MDPSLQKVLTATAAHFSTLTCWPPRPAQPELALVQEPGRAAGLTQPHSSRGEKTWDSSPKTGLTGQVLLRGHHRHLDKLRVCNSHKQLSQTLGSASWKAEDRTDVFWDLFEFFS